jgi:5'-nucleotidase
MKRARPGAALAVLTLCAALAATAASQRTVESIAVQLLAINDFHGNLEPPSGSNGRLAGVDAGGAEYLSTHLSTLAARNANTLIVAAGDLVGASPLLSGMFNDEPTIEALNAMRVDVSSVGNHEFDEGWRELLRIQNGGCHAERGCSGSTPFKGAAFQYLAANVVFDPRLGQRSGPVLPAYAVKNISGARIGFIGLTLQDTPELVMAAGVKDLRFEREAETANRWVRVLRAQNVRAIVVLIHEGGFPAVETDYSGCPGLKGRIIDIAKRMSDDVDVIVSGHTHRAYVCTIDKKLVTSASSFGRAITAIDLTIDRKTNEIVSKTARNVIVTREVAKDPAQTAIIDQYRPFHAAVAGKIIGTIAGDLTREENTAGESLLGNVIADGTLEYAQSATDAGGADLAFMNHGGIRADLLRQPATNDEPRPITYGEASSVLPFRNRVVVQTMTGEMIRQVLEQQFDNIGPGQDRMLKVSRGFTYSYDRTAPKSRRVVRSSMLIGGRPVMPKQEYRVALNEFIATGGDNFGAFTEGTDVRTIGLDLEVFAAYLSKHSPMQPPALDRIARIK